MPSPAPASLQSRVLAIDVLRGLTIALMLLVNDPGDWRHTYSQLDHAAWNGFTLTDFVFPNFLFLVGASTIFSLHARTARGHTRLNLALHILRRAAIIFLLDLLLTAFPRFHLTQLRIYGVLTRIAICYLCVALFCVVTQRARTLVLTFVAILLSYWLLMRFAPVPGLGYPLRDFPLLDPDRNLAAWLDRATMAFTQHWLHTGRLYERTRDPEGLLSTLPAIATTLMGAIAALWLRSTTRPAAGGAPSASATLSAYPGPRFVADSLRRSTAAHLLAVGAVFLGLGLLWNLTFPINKNLWTSSYVLFAGGLSLVTLAACFWLFDELGAQRSRPGRILAWPWLVFGSNAILAYTVSAFLVKTMSLIKVPDSYLPDRGPSSSWAWTYSHVFARHGSTNLTSLAFALAFVALCFVPNYVLWRRRIFLKV